MKKWLVRDLDSLQNVANELLDYYKNDIFFAFYGELGSGKTTLIKCLCNNLGCEDSIQSPTYTIVNEYMGKSKKIFHFDFYRLEEEEELVQIGIEDYFLQDAYFFMEWPQLVLPWLESHRKIIIERLPDDNRIISVE
ncbi:UNVERIFIED_CONTAM: hypothetical protein GTU68_055905 [Idotea baltica]|nr:hypothetical protein [Idotea baltica]